MTVQGYIADRAPLFEGSMTAGEHREIPGEGMSGWRREEKGQLYHAQQLDDAITTGWLEYQP
jgi:hypothetical protein